MLSVPGKCQFQWNIAEWNALLQFFTLACFWSSTLLQLASPFGFFLTNTSCRWTIALLAWISVGSLGAGQSIMCCKCRCFISRQTSTQFTSLRPWSLPTTRVGWSTVVWSTLRFLKKLWTTVEILQRSRKSWEKSWKWLKKKMSAFLQFSFLAIFISQSSLSCFYIFALSSNPSDSFLAMFGMVFTLSELYVCCWTGSRVTHRLKKLTSALHCIQWDKLAPSHRKNLSLVLLITQNIKGFHGVFKQVELMTLLDVISEK